MNPEDILAWIETLSPTPGYILLSAAAMIEYVFPPFPGDTITLLGSVLIENANWSFTLVLLSVTLGSVLGAMIDYEIGAWLARTDRETWLHRHLQSPALHSKIHLLTQKFARHGALYISLNRFLPGIRGVFFLVAAMAGLRRSTVAFYAALSALLWNLIIVAVGYAIGFELERLMRLVTRYTHLMYGLIMVGTAILLWKYRKKTTHKETPEGGEEKRHEKEQAKDLPPL